MSFRQQKIRSLSHPEQMSRDKRLRSAWLAVPDALRSRPEPRSAWDSAARADCPTSPWEKLCEPLRNALRAAVSTGNPDKVKAVAVRIELFFEAMKADVLSVNPIRDEASILRAAIEETEAEHEANVAVMEVLAQPVPCPSSLEKAETKLTVHAGKIERCRTMIGSILRNGVRPSLVIHR